MIFYVFVGMLLGMLLHKCQLFVRRKSFDDVAKKVVSNAEKEAQKRLEAAKAQERELQIQHKTVMAETLSKQRARQDVLNEEKKRLKQRLQALDDQHALLQEKKQKLERLEVELERKLVLQANMTHDEAQKLLLEDAEKRCTKRILQSYLNAQATCKAQGLKLLCEALRRLPEKAIEANTRVIPLSDTSHKAKIIGREGKNLKHFKRCAKVDVVVDSDTEVALYSSDPFRLEVAVAAMKQLVEDGRINPQTIDEALKRACETLETATRHKGYEALKAGRITDMHPELVKLVGKMHLHTTLGQNLLEHSVEVAHLMAMVATELGLDAAQCARIGLLHDVGKVVFCHVDCSHAKAGALIAKEYGECIQITHTIETHHDDIHTVSNEARLLQACDAISSIRPGARKNNSDAYHRRVESLEQIAKSFDGVRQAFALSGSKDLSVFVRQDVLGEQESTLLAQKIAEKIEQSIGSAPHVTVIRE